MVQSSLLSVMSAMMIVSGGRNSALAHVCVVMPLPHAIISSYNRGKNGSVEGDAVNNVSKNDKFCMQISSNINNIFFLPI